MQRRTPDSAPTPGPPGDGASALPAHPTEPLGLISAPAPSSPLFQAARSFLVSQLTTPKGIGAAATAAVAFFVGGSVTIDYVRGVVWPPSLHAEVRLRPETLEIKAWNAGARDDELRNVTLAVTEDGFTTRWAVEDIEWREPEKFDTEGLALAKDGHEFEFARAVGKALPSAVFFELGSQCRFHLEATFDRQPVRIPETGNCACDAACRR